jgi:hypothetical protein
MEPLNRREPDDYRSSVNTISARRYAITRLCSCSTAAPHKGWRRSTSQNLHQHLNEDLNEVLYIP